MASSRKLPRTQQPAAHERVLWPLDVDTLAGDAFSGARVDEADLPYYVDLDAESDVSDADWGDDPDFGEEDLPFGEDGGCRRAGSFLEGRKPKGN
jgi:hypothetical protein